jgi:hypothetical protein
LTWPSTELTSGAQIRYPYTQYPIPYSRGEGRCAYRRLRTPQSSYSGVEAFEMHLANFCLADERFEDELARLAADILANSWFSNQVNKRALLASDGVTLRESPCPQPLQERRARARCRSARRVLLRATQERQVTRHIPEAVQLPTTPRIRLVCVPRCRRAPWRGTGRDLRLPAASSTPRLPRPR